MYCIPVDIPNSLCEIDDELKAIYHSKDSVCIWVFGSREDRNNFVDETAGMLKAERESHFEKHYLEKVTEQLHTIFYYLYQWVTAGARLSENKGLL